MEVKISNNLGDIEEVVNIHLETFEGFFLTFLGKGFLKVLYKGFIEYENSNLIIARNETVVVGFLAYSNDMSSFYKYLIKKHLLSFAWFGFLAFLRKPTIIYRLLSAFNKSNEAKREEKYIELASIGVNPSYKGQGIGSMLIKFLQDNFNQEKYAYISLETDADKNEYVNNFYKKNGFILDRVYETKQGRRMNEYRYGK
jgi:ribosomal protein S18 acetylase RimI-like enzyme